MLIHTVYIVAFKAKNIFWGDKMEISNENQNEIPLGFGMALVKNIKAMNVFSGLTENEQHYFIKKAHNVNSKSEMEKLVSSIAETQII